MAILARASGVSVEASRKLCAEIVRREAKHFYYGMLLLPREKREAIYAIYAFARRCDDLVDEADDIASARAGLARWSEFLAQAYEGATDGDPSLPAFADAVRQFSIPKALFEDLLRGMEMDLVTHRYESFEELRVYGYRVASVVGLAVIAVVGLEEGLGDSGAAEALRRAEDLGVAFQLTNILRDVAEDAGRGRIYLPLEDLRQFGVTEEEILRRESSERFRRLMAFEYERAEGLFDKARPLFPCIHRSGRAAISAMTRIYRALLHEIRRREFEVLRAPVRIGFSRKLFHLVKGWTHPSEI